MVAPAHKRALWAPLWAHYPVREQDALDFWVRKGPHFGQLVIFFIAFYLICDWTLFPSKESDAVHCRESNRKVSSSFKLSIFFSSPRHSSYMLSSNDILSESRGIIIKLQWRSSSAWLSYCNTLDVSGKHLLRLVRGMNGASQLNMLWHYS